MYSARITYVHTQTHLHSSLHEHIFVYMRRNDNDQLTSHKHICMYMYLNMSV